MAMIETRRMAVVPPFAKELLAWAAQGALAPLSRSVRPSPAPSPVSRVTYLLHGAWAPPAVFWPMRRYLEDKVEGELVIWGYGLGMDVVPLARRFARFVAAYSPGVTLAAGTASPAARVDVVGHSLGGLIARYWAQELGGARRLDRLVTLATPHHGTTNARLLDQARDMRPGSELLERLEATRKTLDGVRVTTIAARDDFMVVPSHNALLEGSDAHHLDEVGHNGLLFSPRVFALVADALAR